MVLKKCTVPDNTDLKCAHERIELEISNAHNSRFIFLFVDVKVS